MKRIEYHCANVTPYYTASLTDSICWCPFQKARICFCGDRERRGEGAGIRPLSSLGVHFQSSTLEIAFGPAEGDSTTIIRPGIAVRSEKTNQN